MFEWKLLSDKQIEHFSVLLWKDISDENALPYEEYYFPHTLLRWPAPDDINVTERVKRRLLDCENFKTLKEQALSSMTFGDSVYQNQIQYLNKTIPDFWNINEIEILMKGFIDYWESLKKKFSEATHPEVYKEEFISRVKTLIHTISSFSREKVQQMDNVVIEYIIKMIDDIVRNQFLPFGKLRNHLSNQSQKILMHLIPGPPNLKNRACFNGSNHNVLLSKNQVIFRQLGCAVYSAGAALGDYIGGNCRTDSDSSRQFMVVYTDRFSL